MTERREPLLLSAWGAALHPLLSLLYPPRCAVCRMLGGVSSLCATCAGAITPVTEPICACCGHSLNAGEHCLNCRQRPPAFDCARALGAYDGVLREAIHRFKYHDRPALAEPLGALLSAQARRQASALHDLRFDAVLPVPMHHVRRRRRGYNQSERLARVLAQELGLPLDTKTLVRPRATRPQVGLEAKARRVNLAGAFAVRASVKGKDLLLVDDVMTTGSSLHECAAALKIAGAGRVDALTLAVG